MSSAFVRIPKAALAAPLLGERPTERLGMSLWLYVYLLSVANFRGIACRNIEKVIATLSIAETDLSTWLTRLAESGLIDVRSPSPFLVVKLRSWPDSEPSSIVNERGATESNSYSLLSNLEESSRAIAQEDGGAGEGDRLLQEILDTLGETDAGSFRRVLDHYSSSAIREALSRVRATPAEKVRKSKTALFRYLLAKRS